MHAPCTCGATCMNCTSWPGGGYAMFINAGIINNMLCLEKIQLYTCSWLSAGNLKAINYWHVALDCHKINRWLSAIKQVPYSLEWPFFLFTTSLGTQSTYTMYQRATNCMDIPVSLEVLIFKMREAFIQGNMVANTQSSLISSNMHYSTKVAAEFS